MGEKKIQAVEAEKRAKVFLIILDGFGIGKNYPFNAIQNAKMPFYREISKKFPQARLLTCGEAVGLPDGVMGNSEVGHMNMGAGRIVYQELTRIQKAIRDKDFFQNKTLKSVVDSLKTDESRVHLMGLLSDAGVHSHLDHLKALIQFFSSQRVRIPITVHLFTDGRDTPPDSAVNYVKELGDFIRQYPEVCVGSITGRYYSMDRDQRWDRTEKAFNALIGKTASYGKHKGNGVGAALQVLKESHAKSVTDEFVVPERFEPDNGRSFIADGDAIVFYNFRADRARQLTRAFTEEKFNHFNVSGRPKLSSYTCFTQYEKTMNLPVVFPPQDLKQTLPEILEKHNISQFRIAETEKYAHVTYFFNGGVEKPFNKETRAMIPSPKDVATYDLKPEMSAFEVTSRLVQEIENNQPQFILLNYANPDMVGHTGNYEAAIKALVAVDSCLKKAVSSALKAGYNILISADHGNIEEMQDEQDRPHTQHTLNPVPFHLISNTVNFTTTDGILSDLAPTVLELMGIEKPKEMTARSLLKGHR